MEWGKKKGMRAADAMAPLFFYRRALAAMAVLVFAMDPWNVSLVKQYPSFRAKYVAPPIADDGAGSVPAPIRSSKLSSSKLMFQGEFLGPESIAFDRSGRGPYTGVSDGRVLRWDGPALGWSTFAITTPNRTKDCAPRRPPVAYVRHEHICGRPLGLRFNQSTGDLYIADAYMGLLAVGPEGGLARVVVNHVGDRRIRFANDVDFDDQGFVYFTDTSTKYQRRQYIVSVLEGDDTGRLLRYDPATETTTVLLDGLRFPNGIAVSRDGRFLLIAESITGRLLRYWLKGPKAASMDVFATLPGNPDNVRVNRDGDFWVAMYSRSARLQFLASHPRLKTLLLRIPLPLRWTFRYFAGASHAMVGRYSADGRLLELLEDPVGSVVRHVSEVEEDGDGRLWLGSVILPHIAVYSRNRTD